MILNRAPLYSVFHHLPSVSLKQLCPLAHLRAGGTGGAGGAIAPPIFLKIGERLAFSTPNISRLVLNAWQKIISTPNIVHLPPGLNLNSNFSNVYVEKFGAYTVHASLFF